MDFDFGSDVGVELHLSLVEAGFANFGKGDAASIDFLIRGRLNGFDHFAIGDGSENRIPFAHLLSNRKASDGFEGLLARSCLLFDGG